MLGDWYLIGLPGKPPASVCPYRVLRQTRAYTRGRSPTAWDRAIAWVLLCTLSLRANSKLRAWKKPHRLRACYRLGATMDIEFAVDVPGVDLDRVQ